MNWCVLSPLDLLPVLLTLFLCCISVRSFWYVFFFDTSKFLCIPCIRLWVCLRAITPYLLVEFFSRCFGMFFFFFCNVSLLLDIFLIFLLTSVLSGLFPRVVLSFLLVLLFPFDYYYYYYYYYLLIRVFHISITWWSFTGDWVTTSLLKSPGLFSVFWPFSIMLLFGWSPLGRQLQNPPGPLIILKLPCQRHQSQLV